jgi:hypothetical protein
MTQFLMALILGQATQAIDYPLLPGGWVVMLLSVGFVTLLLAWCIWRVMGESNSRKVHGQIDIDTPDQPKHSL